MAPSATLTPARLTAAVRRRPRLRIALGALAVILGLGGIALGGLLFRAAHATHPVEVDGAIADYQAITINGSYARNDLRLVGDGHTYTFDSRQFHPTLPERLQQDARIQIWVDQGTTNVVALTLYDEMGLNPTAYTTSAYDNPTLAYDSALVEAGVVAALGLVLLLGGTVAALGRGKRWRQAQRQEREQRQARGATPAPGGVGQRVPAVMLPVSATPPASQDRGARAMPPLPVYGSPGMGHSSPPTVPPGVLPGAIPTAQAVPTTPMPGRQPAPPRPAFPVASAASIDEIPTQRAPAVAPGGTPGGAPGMPPVAPAQPDSAAMSGGAAPWGAWGVPSQSAAPGMAPAYPPPAPPPPPGTLPDFPTERLPSAAPMPPAATNPPGDVGDQPTRKSETAGPPGPGHGG